MLGMTSPSSPGMYHRQPRLSRKAYTALGVPQLIPGLSPSALPVRISRSVRVRITNPSGYTSYPFRSGRSVSTSGMRPTRIRLPGVSVVWEIGRAAPDIFSIVSCRSVAAFCTTYGAAEDTTIVAVGVPPLTIVMGAGGGGVPPGTVMVLPV